MKRWTIGLITIVMVIAFGGLLVLQVGYVNTIVGSRNATLRASILRSLQQVSKNLEIQETRRFLQKEVFRDTDSYFAWGSEYGAQLNDEILYHHNEGLDSIADNGQSPQVSLDTASLHVHDFVDVGRRYCYPETESAVERASNDMQDRFRERFYYQKGLLDEVILEIIYRANLMPLDQRIDFEQLGDKIQKRFERNDVKQEFIYRVIDHDGKVIYTSDENVKFEPDSEWSFRKELFSNDRQTQKASIELYFPFISHYQFNTVTILIPSIIFSAILLVTFIITIYIVSRQKKLSEIKADFISNMTHELKTPVSSISLASQMLMDSKVERPPDQLRRIAAVIGDETKRLSLLIEKVLQTSLFERQRIALKLKDVDVHEVVLNVANTLHLKVEQVGGMIDLDLDADNTLICVDQMHFTNVVFNLMENALKYRREDLPFCMIVHTKSDQKYVTIIIEDNGIGIKKDDQKRIFDRFYRVPKGNKHDVKGFGLGLAYVKKIIDEHNGSIRVESELNVGTKFIIQLPIIN